MPRFWRRGLIRPRAEISFISLPPSNNPFFLASVDTGAAPTAGDGRMLLAHAESQSAKDILEQVIFPNMNNRLID